MDHQAFAQLLGNYGEFFGAIAVVVTLIYVGVQVRQNNKMISENSLALRAQAKQTTARLTSDFLETIMSNEPLRSSVMKVLETDCDLDDLSEDERQLMLMYWIRALSHFSDDHFRYSTGLLSEEEWGEQRNMLRIGYVGRPAFRTWWQRDGRDWWGDRFRAYVDSEIVSSNVDK